MYEYAYATAVCTNLFGLVDSLDNQYLHLADKVGEVRTNLLFRVPPPQRPVLFAQRHDICTSTLRSEIEEI